MTSYTGLLKILIYNCPQMCHCLSLTTVRINNDDESTIDHLLL